MLITKQVLCFHFFKHIFIFFFLYFFDHLDFITLQNAGFGLQGSVTYRFLFRKFLWVKKKRN